MDDDFRLQIEFDDSGIAGDAADLLRSTELEVDLKGETDHQVAVSHEGETIYLYAGDRDQLDRARSRSRSSSTRRAGRPSSSSAIGTRGRAGDPANAADPTPAERRGRARAADRD